MIIRYVNNADFTIQIVNTFNSEGRIAAYMFFYYVFYNHYLCVSHPPRLQHWKRIKRNIEFVCWINWDLERVLFRNMISKTQYWYRFRIFLLHYKLCSLHTCTYGAVGQLSFWHCFKTLWQWRDVWLLNEIDFPHMIIKVFELCIVCFYRKIRMISKAYS